MTRVIIRSAMVAWFAMPAALPSQRPADSTYNFGLKQFAVSAAALSVFVLAVDAPLARSLPESASEGTLNTARQFDRFGDATGIVPIIGGVAIAGLVSRNHAMARTAVHAAAGVMLATITVQVGKEIMGRERPRTDPDLDGLDFLHYPSSRAFPSGHTAAAFAVATALGDDIGKTWARAGLYAVAAGTGWARITEKQHWLSDVLAGATIGVVSAKFVSGRMRLFGVRPPQVIVGSRSIGVNWQF